MFKPCIECGREFPKHERGCFVAYCYEQATLAAWREDRKAMKRWLKKAGFEFV